MMSFPPYPIPVTTPLGDGYILYINSGGMYENDEITVVLLDGGHIRHFESAQVKVWVNSTYGIHE
jgi:hypothetical protein